MKLSDRTPVEDLHKQCPRCGSEEMDVSNRWLTKAQVTLVPVEFCWICGWSRNLKGEPLFSPAGTYDDSPFKAKDQTSEVKQT